MIKIELARLVAKRSHTRFDNALVMVDSLFQVMCETLNKGEPIVIAGLGKFHVRHHAGTPIGFNVIRGTHTPRAPNRRLYFHPSASFKRYINGKQGLPFRKVME